MIVENKDQIQKALEQITQAQVELTSVLEGTGVAPAPEANPKIKNKLHVIIDAGHGGIHPVSGQTMTNPKDGKRYTFINQNLTIHEGQINRLIADRFANMLDAIQIGYTKVYHEYIDTGLTERCLRANQVHASLPKDTKAVLMSFHSNAFGVLGKGSGEAPKGWSVFIFPNSVRGLVVAEAWEAQTRLQAGGFGVNFRVHGKYPNKAIWEGNFQMLRTTTMPAALVENLFFTNLEDARLLLSPAYQSASASAAISAVIHLCRDENYSKL